MLTQTTSDTEQKFVEHPLLLAEHVSTLKTNEAILDWLRNLEAIGIPLETARNITMQYDSDPTNEVRRKRIEDVYERARILATKP